MRAPASVRPWKLTTVLEGNKADYFPLSANRARLDLQPVRHDAGTPDRQNAERLGNFVARYLAAASVLSVSNSEFTKHGFDSSKQLASHRFRFIIRAMTNVVATALTSF